MLVLQNGCIYRPETVSVERGKNCQLGDGISLTTSNKQNIFWMTNIQKPFPEIKLSTINM